jgi:hypothetical protein
MVLQEIEGFPYATALDLNMGYYTIRPKSAPSNFFGENISTRDYQWVLQVCLTFSEGRCWS